MSFLGLAALAMPWWDQLCLPSRWPGQDL